MCDHYCQNPIHVEEGKCVIATKILPCSHTFCDWCLHDSKSTLNCYIKCLKCAQLSSKHQVCDIDRRQHARKEIAYNGDASKLGNNQAFKKNLDKTDETILLGCKHRFCHRCFFQHIKPEISREEYCLIKCPNCEEDDERWYKDEDLKPHAANAKANFEFYKKFNTTTGSFIDEIDCIINKKVIHLEFKVWNRTNVRTIRIWSNLEEKTHSVNSVSPDHHGLCTADIPIEGDVYFFKISSRINNVCDIDTKWFGPVDVKQGVPPKMGEIKIGNVSSNSVEMSWKEAKPHKYVVVYGCSIEQRIAAESNWKKVDVLNKTATRYTMKNLKDNTQYEFRLNFLSSVGDGIYENCFVQTMPEAEKRTDTPCTPNLFKIRYTGINEGIFTWGEPSYTFTNNVLEYVLEMKEENGKWIKAGVVQRKFSIPCPFQKMTEGKNYYFRISAGNAHGRSQPCELDRSVKRKTCILSPPEKFDVQILEQNIKLVWNHPPNTNTTDNIQYVVQFKEEYSEQWLDVEQTRYCWVFFPISRMNTNKIYHFQIFARNVLAKSTTLVLKYFLSKNSDDIVIKIQQGKDGKNKEVPDDGNPNDKADGTIVEKSASGCQTRKQNDKKNEEESCIKCHELKPLGCTLSCGHIYCPECCFSLFENAEECFKNNQSVYMWVCKLCGVMTEETYVKFTGTVVTMDTFADERMKKNKNKIEDDPDKRSPYHGNDVDTTQIYQIRGLPNVGMTCYSNCILQVLAQTQQFYDHLETLVMDYNLDKTKSVTGLLLRTLSEINRESGDEWCNRVDYDTIVRLIEKIGQSDQSFQRGEQADCHSFIMALFNIIKDEIQTAEERTDERKTELSQSSTQKPSELERDQKETESIKASCSLTRDTGGILVQKQAKRNKKAPLSQFEGYTTNLFVYHPCSHKELSEKQMFNSLLIPIERSVFTNWTVSEGLEVLQKKETFNKNILPCGECNIDDAFSNWRKKATKRQIFTQLPEVLILQLGKFTEDYYFSSVKKLHLKVDYPLKLKLKECSNPVNKMEYSEKTYILYGVALHSGTIYGGHYSAFVRCTLNKNSRTQTSDDAEWFYCSDSNIHKVSEEDVTNHSKASVLFYQLLDFETHL